MSEYRQVTKRRGRVVKVSCESAEGVVGVQFVVENSESDEIEALRYQSSQSLGGRKQWTCGQVWGCVWGEFGDHGRVDRACRVAKTLMTLEQEPLCSHGRVNPVMLSQDRTTGRQLQLLQISTSQLNFLSWMTMVWGTEVRWSQRSVNEQETKFGNTDGTQEAKRCKS